jgi:hypothetical protein
MTRRRVDANVREIEIEGDKDSTFRLRCVKDSRIGVTSQLLVEYGVYVVTNAPKQGFGVTR